MVDLRISDIHFFLKFWQVGHIFWVRNFDFILNEPEEVSTCINHIRSPLSFFGLF